MFEAYHVAVRLRLIDHVTHGLLGLSTGFARTQAQAAALQATISRIQMTAMAGFAVGASGIFGLMTLRGPYEQAKLLNNELTLMRTLGSSAAANWEALAAARQTALAVPTSTAAQNIRNYREMMPVFGVGNEHEARAMLPIVARVQGVLGAFGASTEGSAYEMLRAIERRAVGAMTEPFMLQQAELMSRSLIMWQGRLDARGFHAALRQAGASSNRYSDEFVYEIMPTLMQMMGQERAGTQLGTFANAVSGRGLITRANRQLWVELGEFRDSDFVSNATGSVQVRPGAGRHALLAQSNPFAYAQALAPGIRREAAERGITELQVVQSMFRNQNAQRMFWSFYSQGDFYRREQENFRRNSGLSNYNALLVSNPDMAELALANQWKSLLAEIGFTILPDLLAGMRGLRETFTAWTAWVQHSRGATRLLVQAFTALAASMAFGGIVLLLSAAFRGLALVVVPLFRFLAFSFTRLLIPAFTALVAAVGWPAVLIGGIVIALTALGVWFYNNNATFKAAVDGFIGELARIGEAVRFWTGQWTPSERVGIGAAGRAIAEGRFGEAGRDAARAQTLLEVYRRAGYVRDDSRRGSRFVRPQSRPANQGPGVVLLDGHRVGAVVSRQQARDMRGAAVGISSHDPNASPAAAAAPYAPH
jgi:hypothetical protein